MLKLKLALKMLAIFVAILVTAGFVYQRIGTAVDAKYAPSRAEMVAVNGHMIHVVCTGEGPRTFILDAGLGAWSFEWFRVQPLLANVGRACAFDRPGLGWSESSGTAHDGAAAADELAAIVAAINLPKPFFYVGHSLGANFAQIYYAKYPVDIAGLVLIEPGDPKDLLEDFHGTRAMAMDRPDCSSACPAARIAGELGMTRLIPLMFGVGKKNLPPNMIAAYHAGLARPVSARTTVAYLGALPKTAYENLDVKTFGKVPVLLFSSSNPRKPEGKETIADVELWHTNYLAYLASLAAKSEHAAAPIVVPDSDHASMVMGERPAAFLAARIVAFVTSPGSAAANKELELNSAIAVGSD
jgi:pimeloyl-ACP methyl ester carboxylesterase